MTSDFILRLIKGVPNNGALTSEVTPTTIDLLQPSVITLDEYILKRPEIKQGGVWADSPISPGRRLISGEIGNVTETIRLIIKGTSLEQVISIEQQLVNMQRDCRDFWINNYQIEPVYIQHQVYGEPGPRFAILHKIELDITAPSGEPTSATSLWRDVVIVIEREGGWRPIPPGANPKTWTFHWRNRVPRLITDSMYGFETGASVASSTSLFAQDVNNSTIMRGGAYCYRSHIDIDASDIPGDLPALLQLGMYGTVVNTNLASVYQKIQTMYVGRRSRFTGTGTTLETNTLPAKCAGTEISSTNGTDATNQNDNGAIDTIAGVGCSLFTGSNQSRVRITFATATDAIRLTWTMDVRKFMGRYIALLRAHQDGGSSGDVRMYLQHGYDGDDISMAEVVPTVQAVATNTEFWPVNYMGVIDIPSDKRAPYGIEGLGMPSSGVTPVYTIRLRARRPNGATANLYVCDLTLIPIDETAAIMDYETFATAQGTAFDMVAMMYDNTGYSSRGTDESTADEFSSLLSGSYNRKHADLRGQPLTLSPGVDNRLYFFWTADRTGATPTTGRSSLVTDPGTVGVRQPASITIHGNIVPRWSGYRDE